MFYFIVFYSIVLLSMAQLSPRQGRFIFYLPAITAYCLLIGFRGESGSDTFLYVDIFKENLQYLPFKEPGLLYLFDAMNYLGLEFSFVCYLQGALCFGSLVFMSERLQPVFVAFYMVVFGLNIDFSTMRQSFAFHILSIMVLAFGGGKLTVLPGFFHLTALFNLCFEFRKRAFFLLLILAGLLVIGYFYLSRYIDVGLVWLTRDDLLWLPQAIFVLLFLSLNGVAPSIILLFALLFYLPVGYRVAVYALLHVRGAAFSKSGLISRLSVFASVVILLFYTHFKLVSFEQQSTTNDAERSTVQYYDDFFNL